MKVMWVICLKIAFVSKACLLCYLNSTGVGVHAEIHSTQWPEYPNECQSSCSIKSRLTLSCISDHASPIRDILIKVLVKLSRCNAYK